MGEPPRKRTGAFFGRRKGHALRPRQATLFETLLPKLAIDLSKPAPADLRSLFGDVGDMRIESGFGGGEHLIAEAERNPRIGFIGIEPFVNGMAKALASIEERGLKNIRLHHGDATDVLAWLPTASLTRFDLIYPDPWRNGDTGNGASCRMQASPRLHASFARTANSGSRATSRTMWHGRWRG